MHHRKINASGHFAQILNGGKLPDIVRHSVNALKAVEFDTLAFIGLSGAVLTPIIAHEMGKELLMVRKNGGNDRSNSGQWIEGNHAAERVVVVDDLISSGKTMSQMMHALRRLQETESPKIQVVGLLLHMNGELVDGQFKYIPKLFLPSRDHNQFMSMVRSETAYPHPVTDLATKYDDRPPLYLVPDVLEL